MRSGSRVSARQSWPRRNKWLLVFLAVYALLSVLLFDPKVSVGGDNAVYLTLAKSIATGKGYVQLHLPDEPAHAQYPFGFPVLLLLVHVLSGGVNVLGAKLLVVLAGIGAVFFMYGICEHLFKKKAWVVMALMVSVPMFVTYNHKVLTEIPFLCFSMGTIYFLLKASVKRRAFYWIGFGLAICAFLLRTAGISLIMGVTLFLLLRKQYKYLGIFVLLFLVAFVPWQIRNASLGQGHPYLEQFLAKNPYQVELGRIGVSDLVDRVWRNLLTYSFGVVPTGLVSLLKQSALAWVAGGVLVGLAIAGFVRKIRNRSVVEAYALFGALALVIWPAVWTGDRFLLSLLPVLVIYIFTGLFWLESKLKWRYFVLAITGILVLLNGIKIVQMAQAAVTDNIRYLKGDRDAGDSPDWRHCFEAIEWIRTNVETECVVMARKPEFVYLLSGHKSICYPLTRDRAEVIEAIGKADYVLFDNFRWTGLTERLLEPALWEERGRLLLAYETGPPKFYVVKVKKEW